MRQALFLAAGLALLASPALSQSSPRPGDRDYDHRDGGWSRGGDRGWSRGDAPWREMRDEGGRGGRGARFMVRSGDSGGGVRGDGDESMRACVGATLTLFERG